MSKAFTSLPRIKKKVKGTVYKPMRQYPEPTQAKAPVFVLCRVLPRLIADNPGFLDLPYKGKYLSLPAIAVAIKEKYKLLNQLLKD